MSVFGAAKPAAKKKEIKRATAAARMQSAAAELPELLRKKIKYVFVIYQENRSFDSYFGTFPGAEGLFSHPAKQTPGFYQELIGIDGKPGEAHPFRIGPKEFAADLDSLDNDHSILLRKMDIKNGNPKLDEFAITEEKRFSPFGNPSLKAKQFGELAMSYEDCDSIPLLWQYAHKFVLFDHIFQLMVGPSTPGNLSIIGAQTGVTQWMLHPEMAPKGEDSAIGGVPELTDDDPFWGSPSDHSAQKMPVNPKDYSGMHSYSTEINLTYATLPLSLMGKDLQATARQDADPKGDLDDVQDDIDAITRAGGGRIPFGWYEEGYDAADAPSAPQTPTQAFASYITHHNGPQYFGYVANNPEMRQQLHGLRDFFDALQQHTLPQQGGVFFVKGGYKNIWGLKPSDPNAKVRSQFLGDDDHPKYSDSQISEALVAEAVNRIGASPYWKQSAIIITWDDDGGFYDHVPPPLRVKGPDGSFISDGPRVPLILISPYAKTHFVSHAVGNHASVVKFVDTVFGLMPLAKLPDELKGREIGKSKYGQDDLGPEDALTPDVTDLTSAFDLNRLKANKPPLDFSYFKLDEAKEILMLPVEAHLGCKQIGIEPMDYRLKIRNEVPKDFNPRPATNPN